MIRIATIVGARPQFVKAAVVSKALLKTGKFDERIIHTGQHYDNDMSAIFFEELGIPEYAFNLGIGSGGHGKQTGQALERIEQTLLELKPQFALVYGDTNSTLAGALAAAKLHIPVAHVEAGLRSFNRKMPEEINRIVADHLSSLLFAPTDIAVKNLEREGIADERVIRVGDVMLDAAIEFGPIAEKRAKLTIDIPADGHVLVTVHRAENTDDSARLREIVKFIELLAQNGHSVIWPVHPRTTKALNSCGVNLSALPRVHLIPPVGFFEMIRLERTARLIATDSGGVQKEAYFHGIPCLILRDETEWQELIDVGAAFLGSPTLGADKLLALATKAIETRAPKTMLYGDGRASDAIADALIRHATK